MACQGGRSPTCPEVRRASPGEPRRPRRTGPGVCTSYPASPSPCWAPAHELSPTDMLTVALNLLQPRRQPAAGFWKPGLLGASAHWFRPDRGEGPSSLSRLVLAHVPSLVARAASGPQAQETLAAETLAASPSPTRYLSPFSSPVTPVAFLQVQRSGSGGSSHCFPMDSYHLHIPL